MAEVYPVLLIDLLMFIFLVYKIIREIIMYSAWQRNGCTKPFGLFLIVHCFNVIMFRLFQYLERHWHYRELIARLAESSELEDHSRTRAQIMRAFKFAACVSFVALTFLATLWYAQDVECPPNMTDHLRNWLVLSWSICFLYAVAVIWKRNSGAASEWDIEITSVMNSRVQRLNSVQDGSGWSFNITINGLEEAKEGLSEAEIQSIKKCRLSEHDKLKMNVTWSDSESSDEVLVLCAICIENIKINDWYKELPKCEHFFHADCIDRWLRMRASCPVCRQIVLNDYPERNIEASRFPEDWRRVLED